MSARSCCSGSRPVALCLLVALGFQLQGGPARAQTPRPQRIVSLAPSITEALFAIGAGGRVVGVTTHCQFPEAARRLPRVGGYLTPSYEAIARLRPDLIVTLPEHADLEPELRTLGGRLLRLDHRNVDGVLTSLTTLGDRLNLRANAARLVEDLRQHLDRVAARAPTGNSRPRVLTVLGRGDGTQRVYAAAPGSLYDDLVTRAGGRNVLESDGIEYPTLSLEGLMRLDPDVILELAADGRDAELRRREWDALPRLRAVQTGRVFVFTDDFLAVPGPRLLRFTAVLADALLAPRTTATPRTR